MKVDLLNDGPVTILLEKEFNGDDWVDFEEVLLKRRSVRKFTSDNVTKEHLNKILEAGLLAPTSMNRKPCNFLVVSNKDTLKELSEVKAHGSQFLADANKAIVCSHSIHT